MGIDPSFSCAASLQHHHLLHQRELLHLNELDEQCEQQSQSPHAKQSDYVPQLHYYRLDELHIGIAEARVTVTAQTELNTIRGNLRQMSIGITAGITSFISSIVSTYVTVSSTAVKQI